MAACAVLIITKLKCSMAMVNYRSPFCFHSSSKIRFSVHLSDFMHGDRKLDVCISLRFFCLFIKANYLSSCLPFDIITIQVIILLFLDGRTLAQNTLRFFSFLTFICCYCPVAKQRLHVGKQGQETSLYIGRMS